MISRRVSIFAILLMVGGCSLTSDKQYEVTTVTTQDAQSFQKTEGQIAAMLARTAGRGRRQL